MTHAPVISYASDLLTRFKPGKISPDMTENCFTGTKSTLTPTNNTHMVGMQGRISGTGEMIIHNLSPRE